ncbi:MAG: FluC/FEX family fluoride channel [Micrococcales bacterium]
MKLTGKVIALTFVGGAIGTFGRYALSTIPDFFFVNFWAANLLGAILIAIFNNISWFAKDDRRAFFTVGITGGFTTMSGLSALVLYSWQTVLVQAVLGVAIYLLLTIAIKRVQRD